MFSNFFQSPESFSLRLFQKEHFIRLRSCFMIGLSIHPSISRLHKSDIIYRRCSHPQNFAEHQSKIRQCHPLHPSSILRRDSKGCTRVVAFLHASMVSHRHKASISLMHLMAALAMAFSFSVSCARMAFYCVPFRI